MASKPTMRVVRNGTEVVINNDDFDPKVHKKMGEVVKEKPISEKTIEPENLIDDLDESKLKHRKKREKK